MTSERAADESPLLAVIRVWAAIAWADGELVPVEAEALRRLIASAGLGPEDQALALGLLAGKVELDVSGLERLDALQRKGIYRAAFKLALIDRTVATEERALLARLERGLGLEPDAVRGIEQSVLDSALRSS